MYRRIILSGHAASGKDYARKVLQEIGLKYGISYTSRPPREGEIDGVDYYFLSKEQFEEKVSKDFWYEYVEFNGWYYGTSNEQFLNTDNVFIMTPKGISLIKPEDRGDSYVVYFNIPESVRIERLKDRQDTDDSMERRLESDRKDFENFFSWEYMVTNPKFYILDLLEDIFPIENMVTILNK